jgi:hypothetical protein
VLSRDVGVVGHSNWMDRVFHLMQFAMTGTGLFCMDAAWLASFDHASFMRRNDYIE